MEPRLLGGAYEPLTFAWCFLEAPEGVVADALLEWRAEHFSAVEGSGVNSSLKGALELLLPLTSLGRRELTLATCSAWTACFDNGDRGGDPFATVSYLSQWLKCRGLLVRWIPDTLGSETRAAKGTYGAVQFELFSPERREYLNYERAIGAVNDGGRWVFIELGRAQPFEQPERYLARRKRDRFTPEMLVEYCSALGVRLCDADFYGPIGTLISVADSLPEGHRSLSLAEARLELGLTAEVPSESHEVF